MDPEIASRFYNSIEPECGEERTFIVDRVRPQLARSITPGKRVLDLGCGAGRFTFAAEEMGADAVGIDCANIPLQYAGNVASERGSNARFVLGDYTALPFAPDSFDVALLMCNIVECSYEDADILAHQLSSILSPGGLLCMDMPDHFRQNQQNGRSLAGYDPSTGRKESIRYIPGRGEFVTHSYFWTVAFVKHVFSRHLELYEDEPLDDGRHWLAFKNCK